ncbi:MAG: hypothetical protein ABFD96_16660, partial [Armatimonadia bacterium]
MCIIIGKYFPGTGWVAVKNRDRNYIPEISFRKRHDGGTEILYFWDDITQYCEGLNSHGIGILSASLMVLDDEKEIESRARTPSRDGRKIKRALESRTAKEAVSRLIDDQLPGNTLVFDQENMYLLEGAWEPGGYARKSYQCEAREIPRDRSVVRTNHGIWLPWAGYQMSGDDGERMSRISSLSRRLIALYVTRTARDPEDILDGLTRDFAHDGQLNALRTSTDKKKMR